MLILRVYCKRIYFRKLKGGITMSFTGFRADRLRKVMKAHEATVKDIEAVFKKAKCNASDIYIRGIITGRSKTISLYHLYLICESCNCSADYLIGLSDEIN